MDVSINPNDVVDDQRVGFNTSTENLHCLIVMNDQIGQAMFTTAGNAFFRGFVTQERETGEVLAKYRFRYKDHDSWFAIRLGPERQSLSVSEKVKYLTDGIVKVMATGVRMMSGGVPVPKEAIICFYPPNPEDSQATVGWLFEQDLIEAIPVVNGHRVPAEGIGQA